MCIYENNFKFVFWLDILSCKTRMGTVYFSECTYHHTVIRYGDQHVQLCYNCSSAFAESFLYCRKKKPIIFLSLCKTQAQGKSDSKEHIRIETSESFSCMHLDEHILNEVEFS